MAGEFRFSATRSSGPGGQNVNKVNTQVELRFSVYDSRALSEKEKQLIGAKLRNRINSEGEIVLTSSTERSQLRNKERVTERFFSLVEKALTPPKRRIKTAPTASSRLKRLEGKKLQAKKKELRKRPDL